MSGPGRNDGRIECKISCKKQDAFEKCFLKLVSETADIPSAQAAAANNITWQNNKPQQTTWT